MREKLYCICINYASGGWDITFYASVMFWRGSNVESINTMVILWFPLLCFLCITTLVPGGANGVLLKLKFPKRYAYADNFGLTCAFLSRFNVVVYCGRSLSHSSIGKVGSKDTNPAKKWFLKVLIALSAAFLRCTCGGTNWYDIFCFTKLAFRSANASLSKMYKLG